MPDSNITKKVLSAALKQLMDTESFEKVTVSDICEACGVSRKTFYYHFQDKYELAEWVFNTEFIAVLKKTNPTDQWETIDAICRYFYGERKFYSGLLAYDGQNSFREYFQSFLFQTLEQRILPDMPRIRFVAEDEGLSPDEAKEFFLHFFSDSILVAIFRWITYGRKIPPEQFVALLKSVAKLIEARVYEKTGLDLPAE